MFTHLHPPFIYIYNKLQIVVMFVDFFKCVGDGCDSRHQFFSHLRIFFFNRKKNSNIKEVKIYYLKV